MLTYGREWMLVVAIGCTAIPANGEDPAAMTIPPEGAWARYHGVTKPDNGPEAVYKSTIRILGREEFNGKACRWIELEEAGDDYRQIQQFLIPETALAKSERPMDEAVRTISRDREGKIVAESSAGDGFSGLNLLFLKPARAAAKPVDEAQVVEYPTGKLTIPRGERGTYSWSRPESTAEFEFAYTLWLNSKVPIGMAREKATLTLKRKTDSSILRTWTMNRYLEDFGLDAKSEFPPK